MSKFRLLPYIFILLLIGCSTLPLNWQADTGPGGIGGTGLIHSNKPGSSGGIGGTGKTLDEGIGGTGRVAKQPEGSGLGGTGIVGTITAFGSIWVNDAHIHFDEQTPITINQSPASSGALQLGQIVAVQSLPEGDAFQASSIDIIHEVVGPIHALSREHLSLEVLNQQILIKQDTVFYDSLAQNEFTFEQLHSGAFIEVSGLRQSNGDIVASRIDFINTPEQIQLIGELNQTSEGEWQINEQRIELDELLVPEELEKRVLVSGYLDGDSLVAESIDLDSIEVILADTSELIYEGYYFEEEMDGLISIGGMYFSVEEDIEFSEEYDLNEPLRINAHLSDEGIYEAEDLFIELEHEEHYIDLLHEDDFEPQDIWVEEDFYEEEHEHFHEEYFEEEYLEDEFYEEELYENEHYEEEFPEEPFYEEEH